jgi:hypothetical protein
VHLALHIRFPSPENFVLFKSIFDVKHLAQLVLVINALAPFNFKLLEQSILDSSDSVTLGKF